MNTFAKRIKRITEAINASTHDKIELLYSDGTSKMLTEFDAICEVLRAGENSDPHVIGIIPNDKPGAGGLLTALWESTQEFANEQECAAEPEDLLLKNELKNKPGNYHFYDWYSRTVQAYWDGEQWEYKDKKYSTEEILSVLTPYDSTKELFYLDK